MSNSNVSSVDPRNINLNRYIEGVSFIGQDRDGRAFICLPKQRITYLEGITEVHLVEVNSKGLIATASDSTNVTYHEALLAHYWVLGLADVGDTLHEAEKRIQEPLSQQLERFSVDRQGGDPYA